MASAYLQDVYEPLSISSAPPGWRALYSAPTETGWYTLPLIGWGVYRVSAMKLSDRQPVAGAIEVPNLVAGTVITSDGFIACAFELETFLQYLNPDESDPEPGEQLPTRRTPVRGQNQSPDR